MSVLTVNCEVQAGTPILNAALEAVQLANTLEVCVEFDFNGVKCCVAPGAHADVLVDKWHEARGSRQKFKFAFAGSAS